MTRTPLRIVYDGGCPFCSHYLRLVRLRRNFDIDLIDARQDPKRARRYGLNLNAGMVADVNGTLHHGADAVWVLARLSSRSGLWNRLLAALFASRNTARAAYPLLRFGRWLTLKLRGTPRL